jgi:hypothetical protein
MQGFIIRFGPVAVCKRPVFASFCVSAMQKRIAGRKSACIFLRFEPAKHAFLFPSASRACKNAAVKTAAKIKMY